MYCMCKILVCVLRGTTFSSFIVTFYTGMVIATLYINFKLVTVTTVTNISSKMHTSDLAVKLL